MKKLDANLNCPSCHGPLSPRVLACDDCGIKVEGPFTRNEFAALPPDLLHFLRIFVHCEGRIKDMEKALGVSYPTVKATMLQLKTALRMPVDEQGPETLDVLEAVAKGELPYDEALRTLKAGGRGRTSKAKTKGPGGQPPPTDVGGPRKGDPET